MGTPPYKPSQYGWFLVALLTLKQDILFSDPFWSRPLCTLYIRPWWFTNVGQNSRPSATSMDCGGSNNPQSVALKLMIFSMPQAAMTTTETSSSSAKARRMSC